MTRGASLCLDEVDVRVGATPLVTSASFTVGSGEWVGLIGPNGAGKSTLVRAVAGLTRYTGSITIDGHEAATMSARQRGRSVALVAQNPVIPEAMTVADYVHLGRTPHLGLLQRESRHDVDVVGSTLDRLELRSFSGRRLATLSGGELQRVLLARALVQQPALLLLDEPTSALDVGHQQDVLDLLDEFRADGLTVLTTMHDLTLAGSYCDRLVLLHHGRVLRVGSAQEVLDPVLLRATYGAAIDVHAAGPGHGPVVVPVRG